MSKYFDIKTRTYICYKYEQIPDYIGTEVHHLVSLPENYSADKKFPVLFELTGNKWNYGNGTVEEAHLALSISLKKDFIVVVLPYVSLDGKHNEVKWWGNINYTVSYIKKLIPFLVKNYSIDLDKLFLCGFSRGAIGVSFVGLYDEDIASLWRGFITHDHFDGLKEWHTEWGRPIEKYRKSAVERLSRAHGRPWYVSYKTEDNYSYETQLRDMGVLNFADFYFAPICIMEKFKLDNKFFKHPHNDIWPAFDIKEANNIRYWLNQFVNNKR